MPKTAPLRAALWMIGATLSFSSMALAGRAIAVELDTFELMLFRSLIGVVIITTIAVAMKRTAEIERRDMPLHLFRNIGHFTGQNLWFFAVAVIPLAQLFALEFTTPLWIALLAPIFLGEKYTRARLLAVAIGFLGILLVAQPGQIEISGGVIAAAGSAIGFAVSLMVTKRLTQRGHSVLNILFWLTVTQSIFALVCAGYDGDIALPSLNGLPFVVIVSVAGLSAHFCITTALSLAPATFVAPLDFIRLPLIGLVGYLFYNETINLVMVIGAVLILSANLVNLRAEQRRQNVRA
ncbi:drug/metabolite transporter (DMT)-like permease [Rubricella aquisinus]|uniref:Drug/metabolite transporter (DMT)-like permease n=1 Tax=Rubricella aquisinus TaxID=2028108 RepID=A0A840WZE2_9RHOB|nr:DMT family transporter [Rubricella aquisinus]MBB5515814.1 drug/metabolite transporter (DMT)-like permease [Rubricella aquisinus]